MLFFRVLGALLLKAGAKLTGGRVQATSPQALFMFPGRLGGELTPQDVSNIMLWADQGYKHRLVDLATEAREKDCHLHAVLSTFELSLAGMEVQVVPASPKRRDHKVARWVERMLNGFGSQYEAERAQDLSSLISFLAGAYYYGHAVAEIIWQKKGGELWPVGFEPVEARRFIIDPTTCRLSFWDECGGVPYPGIDLQRAFPNRYIQFQPRVLGTGVAREGLMRPLVWAAMFRNWSVTDWMTFAEMAGKPWLMGKYEKGDANSAGDGDIKFLMYAIEHLSSNGRTVIPKTVDITVEWPKATGSSGQGGVHPVLCVFMADEMSKAVLGQTETTQSSTSSGYAQAKVHNEVRRDRRDAAARSVAAIIRQQLVARAVALNFGADTPVPEIVMVGKNDVDVPSLVNAIKSLADPKIGMPFPVAWLWKLLGVPTPKPGEMMIGNPFLSVMPTDEDQKKTARRYGNVAVLPVGQRKKARVLPPRTLKEAA